MEGTYDHKVDAALIEGLEEKVSCKEVKKSKQEDETGKGYSAL